MMDQNVDGTQVQNCPQCHNHCPADALRCGKGRKYFGAKDKKHGRKHKHDSPSGGLPCLLHRCGRFVHHAGLEEDALFQPLTEEERTMLQSLLEKLAAGWQVQFGSDIFDRHHHAGKHHHKHKDHDK